MLIYLTTSGKLCLYHITHLSHETQREERQDYGLNSPIIVKNYETNLLDENSRRQKKVLSKSHIVCLQRESVSEARMDVFQTMVWWRRTITCCNILLRSAKKMFLQQRRKTKENKIYSAFWSRFLQDIAIPSTLSCFISSIPLISSSEEDEILLLVLLRQRCFYCSSL